LRRFSIRNHRKLLTCDGKVAFVGGFNLGPEWIGDGVERGWRDLGLVLEGPMLGELEASFDALYDLAEFRHRRFARWRRAVGRRTCCTHGAELLLNGPGRGHNVIGQSLRQDFERPLDITIIAAYFLPPRRLRRALARAVRRGGRVRLILAGQSDVPWMQLATRSLYRRLLKAGIEIHEYQPQVLHTKFIRVGEVVYVGSANLDNRSLHINYDFLLRLPDAALAASAGPLIDDHFAHARKIHFEEWAHGRPFWTRLKQRLALWVFSTLDPYIMRLQLQRLG
jgi:cardiolipin synthase